jgi:rhodanese-related sulfurtransferase
VNEEPMQAVSPADIRQSLLAGREIALIDLREEDLYSRDHPLFAANLPLSRLELEILDRVPRRDCRVILYDDGDGLAASAGQRLFALGYANVALLAGGLAAWRAAGYELFRDVNSASKAFGELVEQRAHTPSLTASEVRQLLDNGADMVVLDARRFDEYRTMSIPTGISVPGAELVLRAASLAPDPATAVIVNCAGRTRSLIGAQSLINAGLPNKVFALRNGTIGWSLAGLALEHGADRRFGEVGVIELAKARAQARRVADRAGVKRIAEADLDRLRGDKGRATYCFDVRDPDDYEAGHLPGFRAAPGGQLVQETDVFAPVRGARLVLFDDLGARADMTGSWLAQMGWQVHVLDGVGRGRLSVQGAWQPSLPTLPPVALISADQLAATPSDLLDFGPSPAYRRGHVAGAHFIIRSRLATDLPAELARSARLVLVSQDDKLARFAAADLLALGIKAKVLAGGLAAWRPRPVESGQGRALSAFDDVYRRPYEGTDNPAAAMQAYLDWEFGLVKQLERDGTHGFRVLTD